MSDRRRVYALRDLASVIHYRVEFVIRQHMVQVLFILVALFHQWCHRPDCIVFLSHGIASTTFNVNVRTFRLII